LNVVKHGKKEFVPLGFPSIRHTLNNFPINLGIYLREFMRDGFDEGVLTHNLFCYFANKYSISEL
jgi:hypothetical protein